MNPRTVLLLASFERLTRAIQENPPATAAEVIARLVPFTIAWQKEGESEDYRRAQVAKACRVWADAIAARVLANIGSQIPGWAATEAMIELSTAFSKRVAELPTDQANKAAAHRIEWPLIAHATKTDNNVPSELGAKSGLKKRRKRPSLKVEINRFAMVAYFLFQRERQNWPQGLTKGLATTAEENKIFAMLPEILALPELTKKTARKWGVLAFKHTDLVYNGKIEDASEFAKYAVHKRERKANSNGATTAIRSQKREGIREAFVKAFIAMAAS